MNDTTLFYFFSSLAQCAAGFAALIGVFAVFRLQANALVKMEEYNAARNYLRLGRNDSHTLPLADVKKELERLKNLDPGNAGNIYSKIEVSEEFDRSLVYDASKPLKYWALTFFFAIAVIPFINWFIKFGIIFQIALVLLFLGGIAWTMLLTKKFVQKCLTF